MDRTAFRHLCPGLIYDDHVRGVYYGDDKVLTVVGAPEFNQITLAKACLELFGLTWLTPEKTEVKDPYVSLWKTSFISRQFIRHPDLPLVFGALELDTIREIPLWVRTNDPSLYLLRFRQNCEASLREMMPYGRPAYEAWKLTLDRCLVKNGMPPLMLSYLDVISGYVARA
jgi:hypothetical protein